MKELAEDAEVRAVIRSAVDDANRSVSRAESIREFALLPEDLSIAAGELTPTLKVRRAIVDQHYDHIIERIYHMAPHALADGHATDAPEPACEQSR